MMNLIPFPGHKEVMFMSLAHLAASLRVAALLLIPIAAVRTARSCLTLNSGAFSEERVLECSSIARSPAIVVEATGASPIVCYPLSNHASATKAGRKAEIGVGLFFNANPLSVP